MSDFNFGGSWLDEFCKIAEEKGWADKLRLEEGDVEFPPKVELGKGKVEYPPKVELGKGKVEKPSEIGKGKPIELNDLYVSSPSEIKTGPTPEEHIPMDKTSAMNISYKAIEENWGSLPDSIKEKIIPGWKSMSPKQLFSRIANAWGEVLNANRTEMFKRKKDIDQFERAKEVDQFEGAKKIDMTKKRFGVSPQFIAKLQAFLMNKTGLNVSDPNSEFLGAPDGIWGPRSAEAWNVYAEKVNGGPSGSVPQVVNHIEEDGGEFPRMDDIQYIMGNKTAKIVYELTALANDLDRFGETKAADAVDQQIKIYASKLYGVFGETGEDLINDAHPGGGPTLAPAKDEGGKVETVVEEQKKSVDKATKAPTGKLAQMIGKLIATANKLDESGDIEAAKVIDKTIAELLPFENRRPGIEASGSEDNIASKTAEFDQIRDLRIVLYGLEKILKNLEGNVRDQNPRVIKDILGVDVIGNISFKNKWDEMKTTYSAPNMKGPWSYQYDEAIEKLRKEVESWKSQLYTWPKRKNHTEWILQKLNSWSKIFDPIKKFYKDFPEEAGGQWDNSFDLKFDAVKEKLQDISKKFSQSLPKQETKTPEVKVKEEPKSWVERLQLAKKKRLEEDRKQYIQEVKNLASYITNNSEDIEKKYPKGTVIKLLQWADKEEKNINNKSQEEVRKDMKGVKELLLKIQKQVRSASIKIADVPTLEPSKQTGPVAPSAKKHKSIKKDPRVGKIQGAMKEFGIPVKVDETWGQESIKAWDILRSRIPQARLSPGTMDYSKLEFDRAERFMNYLSKKMKGAKTKFEFNGKEYLMSDFESVSNFLSALDRNHDVNVETMHEGEHKREVYDYIKKIWTELSGEKGQFIGNYYGPDILNQLKVNIVNLARNIIQHGLPKKETPEGLPKMPEEKRPSPTPTLEKPKTKQEIDTSEFRSNETKELTMDSTPVEIFNAIRFLPRIQDKDYFFREAISSFPESGKDAPRKYWNMLNKKINNIVRILLRKKYDFATSVKNGYDVYKDLEYKMRNYSQDHYRIGRQLGFKE